MMGLQRADVVRHVAALGLVAFFGWYAFGWEHDLVFLWVFDLATHELGHFVFMIVPAGDLVLYLAGSVFQIGVPLAVTVLLVVWKRSYVEAGVAAAWTAMSAEDVSVYMADAPFRNLALITGSDDGHDWWNALGPRHLDRLDRADEYASYVRSFGWLMLLVGFGLVIASVVVMVRRNRPVPVSPTIHVLDWEPEAAEH